MISDETLGDAEMVKADSTEPTAAEEQAVSDAPVAGTEDSTGWTEDVDAISARIVDRETADLTGIEVESTDGEVVYEVDNFALEGEDVVAIVGIAPRHGRARGRFAAGRYDL